MTAAVPVPASPPVAVGWTRLPATDTLLVACPADGAPPEGLAGRLVAHYRPVLGAGTTAVLTAPAGGALLGVVAPAAVTVGDRIAWGTPLAAAGPAGDADLDAALADPAAARRLTGRFVLAARCGAALRLVTSADLVHTLVRVDGPRGRAWSTRGWAALAAAGAVPRLNTDAVAEFVLFDHVLADEELLAGVRVLPEATVVDLGAGAATERCYWPLEARVAGTAATTPAALREVLGAALRPVLAVPGLELGLTGGRDSLLVASCLDEIGGRVATMTMGTERFPDARAAAVAAAALGWPHRTVPPAGRLRPDWQRVRTRSRWTDGLVRAWDLVGQLARRPEPVSDPTAAGDPRGALLAGNGGEIGRAFHWHGVPAGARPDLVADVADWARPLLPAAVRAALTDRLAATVASCAPGRTGADALDLFYARSRVRSWLGRGLPPAGTAHLLTAYTSPTVVAALLAAPVEDRRTGRLFDAAAALGRPDLYAVVRGAAPSTGGGLATRLPAPVRRAYLRRHDPALRVGARLAAGRPDPVVARLLGRRWWAETVHLAPSDRNRRRWLWNALAVEALADLLG